MISLITGTLHQHLLLYHLLELVICLRCLTKMDMRMRLKDNRALEKLAKAKELFYENEVEQHDRIQKLRQELADANAGTNETHKALDLWVSLSDNILLLPKEYLIRTLIHVEIFVI